MFGFGGFYRLMIGAVAMAGVVCASVGPVEAQIADLVGMKEVDIAVGGVVVVVPRYEGSKQYKAMAVPFAAPGGPETDKDRFRFKGPDDLRLRLFDLQNLEVGPLGGWRFGREEDDADRLLGTGDIDGGLVVGAYAAYRLGALTPFVSYHHQVTGSDTGGILRFGAEAKAQMTPWLKLTAVAGATWADDDYMSSFFGVTAAQSAASGLAAFDAHSGIKDAFVDLGGEFMLDSAWKVKLSGRYTRLLGDAASSPISETSDQFSGMAMLTYTFRMPLP